MGEQEFSIVPAGEARRISRNIGAIVLWRPATSRMNASRAGDKDPCELRSAGDASLLPQRVRSL